MIIGLPSKFNPDNRMALSGTLFSVTKQLRRFGEVKWIPIQPQSKLRRFVEQSVNKICKTFHKRISWEYTRLGSRLLLGRVDVSLFQDCDVVFHFFDAPLLAGIKGGKPSVYLSDATFPVMLDYYPQFSRLFGFNKRQGCVIERRALDNADEIVLSSDWASASAINDLGQNPSKIHILKFGSNFDCKDSVKKERAYDGQLQLLFVGVDWERKGGNVAVEACEWLRANGVDAVLNIAGIKKLNPAVASLPYVRDFGVLDKNNPDQLEKLIQLYSSSHCMLLPTKAECSGIVFSEAASNGLPAFTYDTGGVGDYVLNGLNGFRLPLGSPGAMFGETIKRCLLDGKMAEMSKRCYEISSTSLNWDVWGDKVKELLDKLTSR